MHCYHVASLLLLKNSGSQSYQDSITLFWLHSVRVSNIRAIVLWEQCAKIPHLQSLLFTTTIPLTTWATITPTPTIISPPPPSSPHCQRTDNKDNLSGFSAKIMLQISFITGNKERENYL